VTPFTKSFEDLIENGGIVFDADPPEAQLRARRPDVEVVRVDIADRSFRRRAIVYEANSNRQRLTPRGETIPEAAEKRLRDAVARAEAAGIQRLLVVTFLDLAEALKREGASQAIDRWRASGRTLDVTFHGDCADDERWASYDGYVTIGDPWPDGDATAAHAQAFEINFEHEYVRRVRAELARAHGAALDVTRDEPAWHLHIGTVAPFGWTDENTIVERLPQGRRPNHSAMDRDEFEAIVRRVGSLAEVARQSGISTKTLTRYRTFERAIAPKQAEALRALSPPGPKVAYMTYRGVI
jgi:hypothetical protein